MTSRATCAPEGARELHRVDGKIIRTGAVGVGGQLFAESAIARFRSKVARGLMAEDSDFPHYDRLSNARDILP